MVRKVSPRDLKGPVQSAVWACPDMPGILFARPRGSRAWHLVPIHPFGRGFKSLREQTSEKVWLCLRGQQFQSLKEAISSTRLAWDIES